MNIEQLLELDDDEILEQLQYVNETNDVIDVYTFDLLYKHVESVFNNTFMSFATIQSLSYTLSNPVILIEFYLNDLTQEVGHETVVLCI